MNPLQGGKVQQALFKMSELPSFSNRKSMQSMQKFFERELFSVLGIHGSPEVVVLGVGRVMDRDSQSTVRYGAGGS